MTREAFRKRLLKQKGASNLEDGMLRTCALLQIELQEADGNVILDMPSFQFDMILEELSKKYKSQTEAINNKRGVDVFGSQ